MNIKEIIPLLIFVLKEEVNKKEISGNFLLYEYTLPNVYVIITPEKYKFITGGLLPFLNLYYRKISKMSMDSAFLFHILKRLENILPGNKLRIVRIIKKGWGKK